MKNLFNVILLIAFCTVLSPAFASDPDAPDVEEEDTILEEKAVKKESYIREQKKNKKKKGERNVKIQPSEEEDKKIILELD